MKKLLKGWNVVSSLLIVLLVLLSLLLVGVRIVGLQPLYVMSGSMEPAFPVGSLILVQKTDPASIQVGDPITYTINEAGDYSTHRVIEIVTLDNERQQAAEENGTLVNEALPQEETGYYFYTKGDANNAPDGSPVYWKNVVGKPCLTIPYLGYLARWLQTPKGRIMGISIALVMIILTFLPDLLRWVDEDDRKKADKENRGQSEAAEKSPEQTNQQP